MLKLIAQRTKMILAYKMFLSGSWSHYYRLAIDCNCLQPDKRHLIICTSIAREFALLKVYLLGRHSDK